MTGGTAAFPQTKFHRPPARDEHIQRSRLLEAIARSGARLVLVNAPAGYGKSTLLAQWSAQAERVAWVSLDSDDTGPRLWAALLTSLRSMVGADLDPILDAAEAPGADLRSGVLIALLDVLAGTAEPLTMVLDDLHLVTADEATRDSLDWFLARLPSAHRVLLATRRDAGLGALARMRVSGDVLDVRVDDLRFGTAEARRFLGERLDLTLDDAEIDALDAQTDGWPAALYLAAMRLRVGTSADAVAERLAASGPDLFEDLTDELMRTWSPAERRFLMESSILDRFTADLCARVLGGEEAATRAAFAELTRTSLMLVPLDRSRTWFRCHHLLRDALRRRLTEQDPARVRELHLRAGAWLESEGGESELREALGHYLTAGEWDLAAELLARHALRFVQSGSLGGWAREWLAGFPPEVVRADARLAYVGALLAALDGNRELRDAWLEDGRRAAWSGPMPDGTASFDLAALGLAAMVCFDDLGGALDAAAQALSGLPAASPARAAIAALSSWHALLGGDLDAAERLAVEAGDGLSAAPLPLVAYLPPAVRALVACERGQLATARRLVAEAIAARDAGPLRGAPHTLPVTCAAARVAVLDGDARAAITRCEAGLEMARDWRDSSLMVPAALLELARAYAATGDAEAAIRTAQAGLGRVDRARDPGVLPAALRALAGGGPSRRPAATADADELSTRELEVLRALVGTRSLREVADALFISHNTIKTHTRALYAKLGVASREEAVAQGRSLGLLSTGRKEIA